MDGKTKFSIITPCWNSEKTIARTIESVMHQSYRNFEYIIIDGGSTDETLKIIEGYINEYPGVITLVSEKDEGIYDAMNKGIRLANGDLIGIVNSDDYYEINALEIVSEKYNGDPFMVLYGMLRILKNEKEREIRFFNHNFLNEGMITHATCFVTKKTYEEYGMYSLEYKSASDYDLMLRYYESSEVSFVPIYSIISNFSLGGISSSATGRIETCKVEYRHGLISYSEYKRTVFRLKLNLIVKPRLKFWRK